MGYINIFVSRDAYIYVKDNQLKLDGKGKVSDFPLEDVNSVMIENLSTTISTYTLSRFAELGILVFICNQNHLPCGVVLPFCEHYQTLSQYENQVALSKPLKKQLWQTIIKNKIGNQNDVWNTCGGMDNLLKLQETVLSGDSENNEAKASLLYFKGLFGKNFIRRSDDIINGFLNYGYSIIRGFVARSIVTHGLMPFLGVFHHNLYNSFNLADDIMEVFRPQVDLYVKLKLTDKKELTPTIKGELYNIVNMEISVDNQRHSVSTAIDMFVESFAKSIKENKNLLKTIKICGIEIHEYE